MRRAFPAAVLAVLAASACQPTQGPAGTVTERHDTYKAATKQWTYQLTVRKPDGTTSTFKVLRDDYKACPEQSAYPTCTGGK